MKIRQMTIDDIGAIRAMANASPELAVNDEKQAFWGTERLTSWITQGDDVMLVAEHDGLVVGFQITNIHTASKIGYLSDIVVDQKYRGTGIGSKLLDETVRHMKQKGITYVYALTQQNNIKIHSMLEKHGFTRGERMIWYDLKL